MKRENEFEACKNGNLEKVKLLIKDCDIDNYAILLASCHGHLEVVKLLLSVGFDPKEDDNFAIRFASWNGHQEVVKLLLGEGCDPTVWNNCSIINASCSGHLEVVKLLLSVGCDPAADDNRAVLSAYSSGHLEVVKLLLSKGCYHDEVKPFIFGEIRKDVKKLRHFFTNKYLILEIIERLLLLPVSYLG